jgi:hypothetical protein
MIVVFTFGFFEFARLSSGMEGEGETEISTVVKGSEIK